jgi:methylmalonyl-CoA mutase cobalamin-binding subunit
MNNIVDLDEDIGMRVDNLGILRTTTRITQTGTE